MGYYSFAMIGCMKCNSEGCKWLAYYSLIFYGLQHMYLELVNQMVYNGCVMMEVCYDSIRHGKRVM